MKKKLQVFISSTFNDLKEERQAAVSAILTMGHIPAGMELFTANDKSQWETIERWINESDIYILILGGRYGSIDEDSGLSYTEKEFNYAVKAKKPLFSIVINEQALKDKIKLHGADITELENTKEMKAFRVKVLKKMVLHYDDIKDIKLAIMSSLPPFESRDDISGWISGNEVPDTRALIDEVSTLIVENEKLKKENVKLLALKGKKVTNEDDFEELYETLSKIKIPVPDEISKRENVEFSVFELFTFAWKALVEGLTNQLGASKDDLFLFDDVCPQLQIYGLVTNEKTSRANWTRYTLTSKGQRFVAYINKNHSE